jgi:replicative superfamily II helicase
MTENDEVTNNVEVDKKDFNVTETETLPTNLSTDIPEVPKHIEIVFNLHQVGCQYQEQETVKYSFTDGKTKVEFSTAELLAAINWIKTAYPPEVVD